MDLPTLAKQAEASRELRLELPPIVPNDLEAAAGLRPIQSKGGEDDVASHWYAPAGQPHVGSPILGVGEEVEERPVVPDIKPSQTVHAGDVGTDPTHVQFAGSRTLRTQSDRRVGDVDDRDLVETILGQPARQRRGPASDVDDSTAAVRYPS